MNGNNNPKKKSPAKTSYLKVDATNLPSLDVRGAFGHIWLESSTLLVDVSVNLWLRIRVVSNVIFIDLNLSWPK